MSVKHGVGLFHTLIWTLVPYITESDPGACSSKECSCFNGILIENMFEYKEQ